MITRVLNADGTIGHDCEQLGCSVSWDGYVLDVHRFRVAHEDNGTLTDEVAALGVGDAVPGATNPGEGWEPVSDGTVKATGAATE